MLSRLLFFIIFGLILTVAGGFLAIVLFFDGSDRSSANLPRAPLFESTVAAGAFEGRTPAWTVRGRLVEVEALGRAVRVEFRVQDANGYPLPEDARVDVSLEMIGHAMTPIRATVARLAPGVYHAMGPVAMPGRWQVGIRLPDGVFQHTVNIGK